MIKPPSLTRETTWIYSGDPALDAPPENAPKKAAQAWADRLKVARQTGQWDGLLKAGQKPTLFTVRIIPGTPWRALMDSYHSGKRGPAELSALVARLALVGVMHLQDADGNDVDVKFTDVAGLGSIADQKVVDVLDGYSPDIIGELSQFVMERQTAPGPLS